MARLFALKYQNPNMFHLMIKHTIINININLKKFILYVCVVENSTQLALTHSSRSESIELHPSLVGMVHLRGDHRFDVILLTWGPHILQIYNELKSTAFTNQSTNISLTKDQLK